MERDFAVAMGNTFKKAAHWTEQVQFNEKYVEWKLCFIKMMSEHVMIWDGHLVRIPVAMHCNNLNPSDAAPIHSTSYYGEPRQHQFEKEEIE